MNTFNPDQDLTIDNLMSFFNFYFSNREKDDFTNIQILLEEMKTLNLTLHDLAKSYKKLETYLEELEEQSFFKIGNQAPVQLGQVGICRVLLILDYDDYFKRYLWLLDPDFINWRNAIRSGKSISETWGKNESDCREI